MEIRHLYEFTVLAKTQNFNEAAEILYLSQPTLTRHIKALEDEICHSLIDRNTRNMHLTEYGQMLLEYAEKINDLYKEYMQKVQLESKRQAKVKCINVAVIFDMVYYGINKIFEAFRKKYDDNYINVYSASIADAREKLVGGDCAFAFIRSNIPLENDDKYVYIPFKEEHIIGFVHKDHPMAEYDKININMLREKSIISLPYDTQISENLKMCCQNAGFAPIFLTNDYAIMNLVEYVKLGMGIGVLPADHLGMTDNLENIKIFEIEPEIKSYIYFCYLKNHTFTETELAFIDTLNEFTGDIIKHEDK